MITISQWDTLYSRNFAWVTRNLKACSDKEALEWVDALRLFHDFESELFHTYEVLDEENYILGLELTAEQLFDWDPDIILVDNHGNRPDLVIKSMKKQNSKWSTLKAVKNDELHRIPAGVFFIDKGSTTTLLVLWMAKTIHPELFEDLDLVEEIKYYFD